MQNLSKSLEIRGTLTLTDPGPGRAPGRYVFQKTAPGHGNDPTDPTRSRQIRRHVIPTDPQTALQLDRRAAFAAAVAAWHALPAQVRDEYRARASKASRTAYNLFLSETLKKP